MSDSVTTVSGLASGIDWQEMVDALMEIEYQSVYRLEEKVADYEERQDAWSDVTDKLEAFQSASDAMDKNTELLVKNSSSSDTDIISTSADADAIASTHTILVNQLAQNEVMVHTTGWADAVTTSLTSSGQDFTYTYDSIDYTVTLHSGATLTDLMNAINEDENNYNIQTGDQYVVASIIDDGGDTDPFHLVLTAVEGSSSNLLSINDTLTTIGGGVFDDNSGTNWATTQNAQAAQIRVDGYPDGDWITRTTNEIDDVISGLTLNLKATSTVDPIVVKVTTDYNAIVENISQWVDKYNEVMGAINTYTDWDEEEEERGVLMSDSQIKSVRDSLIYIVTGLVESLPDNARYTTLAAVGLDFKTGGTLEVDEDVLKDALETSAQDVANLFIFSTSTSNSALEYQSSTEYTQGGTYDVTAFYTAAGKLDKTADNTIAGYPATVEGNNVLVGAEGTPVEGLRIWFNYPGGGAGSVTASVRIGNGVSVSSSDLVEKLTDEFDGLIKTVQDSYDEQISRLEDQIEAYEDRLDTKQSMLESQFIAMESAISQMQNQSSWVGSI